MSLRFRGGERLQRGRGIGGLLRLAKGLFSPLAKTIKGVVTSNTGKAIGKAVKNQLVESGANIASDVLMGNDVNESIQRELQNTRQNAAIGIQKIKRKNINKPVHQPPSKKKIRQSKFNRLSYSK
jgi:hypothetical protein